jgi:2-oxo-4-hydroxy-4-carboxy-5-ureidoimidazoline decarboxylase
VSEPHQLLNALSLEAARAALGRCCGAQRWVDGMLARRPFADTSQLLATSDEIWAALERSDYLEAFAQHPPIGVDLDQLSRKFASTAGWAAGEQSGAQGADADTVRRLRDQNLAYAQRFGYIFIICASGKSATQLLAALEARLPNPPERELPIAAAEQAAISKLRLQKLA